MSLETTEAPPNKTDLYRHFDKDGELLYVGTSLSAIARLRQHKKHSRWFVEIARIDIESFDDRYSALQAERDAIIKEKPLWNIRHNGNRVLESKSSLEVKFEAAREVITHSVITLHPLYTVREVARALNISQSDVRRWIAEGKLGYLKLPNYKDNKIDDEKKRIRITGWHILDCIELLARESA